MSEELRTGKTLIKVLAQDKSSISYRPKLAQMTNSVTAAILLQQILYWWDKSDGAFYKFKEPCKHKDYKQGDSWCEELGFNKNEFDNALKTIGTKVVKGKKKSEALEAEYPERIEDESEREYTKRLIAALRHVVIYWTDGGRVTWYTINEDLLAKFINRIYLNKSDNLRYLVKTTTEFTYVTTENGRTYKTPIKGFTFSSETTPETISETTTIDSDSENSTQPEQPAPIAASGDAAHSEKPLPENIVQQITDILVKKDAELLPAKSKRKKKQPLDIDAEYKKLVRSTFSAWGTRTEGVASMLLALADDGEYKRYMLDPVMSFEELKAYQFWQNRTSDKEFRPQRAETIYNWIDKWRNTKEYQQWLQKQQQPEPAPVTQPVAIVQEPDFESVDIIQKIWDDALARGENPALAAMQYAAQKLSANSSDLKARAKEAQHVSATEPEKA